MEIRSLSGMVAKKLRKLSRAVANSNEESSISEQIPSGEIGLKTPNELHSRNRRAVLMESPQKIHQLQLRDLMMTAVQKPSNQSLKKLAKMKTIWGKIFRKDWEKQLAKEDTNDS
ncbi:transcription factor bHLH78-like [Olea europaea subsp. europaea]|uniref:Transcription factor bHLH78-like n=1 Tax=Olea europaea subsp. europaea TaxID=158383 RepID=A0A8S0V094_OLEEU|nr:transcription factor bHLH78-like [Olea europaea subsp. europaea]